MLSLAIITGPRGDGFWVLGIRDGDKVLGVGVRDEQVCNVPVGW